MPTVRQNISYAYTGFMRAHRPAVRHLAKSILAILAVALLLETFLFNLNYFTSAAPRQHPPRHIPVWPVCRPAIIR